MNESQEIDARVKQTERVEKGIAKDEIEIACKFRGHQRQTPPS